MNGSAPCSRSLHRAGEAAHGLDQLERRRGRVVVGGGVAWAVQSPSAAAPARRTRSAACRGSSPAGSRAACCRRRSVRRVPTCSNSTGPCSPAARASVPRRNATTPNRCPRAGSGSRGRGSVPRRPSGAAGRRGRARCAAERRGVVGAATVVELAMAHQCRRVRREAPPASRRRTPSGAGRRCSRWPPSGSCAGPRRRPAASGAGRPRSAAASRHFRAAPAGRPRPARRARSAAAARGCSAGLGSTRTSNTKSASSGTPCLKANDSNASVSRLALACTSSRIHWRSWVGRSWLVSMTVETSRSPASSSRSSSMASVSARRPSSSAWSSRRRAGFAAERCAAESGCRRRVSEKRRTSASVLASRNTLLIATPFGAQFGQQRQQVRQRARAAHVHRDRDATLGALVLQAQKVAQQFRRQVVDAEQPGVLEARAARPTCPSPRCRSRARPRAGRGRRVTRAGRSWSCLPAPCRARRAGSGEQLLRVRQAGVRDALAAEHARDLGDARLAADG